MCRVIVICFASLFWATASRTAYYPIVKAASSSPTLTHVFDVENMLGYLDRFRFCDILESYDRNNKSMLTALSHSSVPLLKDAEPGHNPVRERFLEFGRNLEKEIFGAGKSSDLASDEQSS